MTGFQNPRCMVSKWWMEAADPCFCGKCGKPPSIENLRRIDWFEFFTNFRRFNLNANTGDLSTAGKSRTGFWGSPATGSIRKRPGSRDVFSAPHGILARACARAVAQEQDTRTRQAAADRRIRGGI